MSNVPMLRRFTAAAPAALNVNVIATDDETTLGDTILSAPNTILDMVNDPDLAAGINHTVSIWKNGVDTGRRFYTTGMSAASAGRVAVGPVNLGPGRYQFRIMQTLGALSARSIVLKFAKAL